MREIIGHISFDISHLSFVTYNGAIRVWIDRQAKDALIKWNNLTSAEGAAEGSQGLDYEAKRSA